MYNYMSMKRERLRLKESYKVSLAQSAGESTTTDSSTRLFRIRIECVFTLIAYLKEDFQICYTWWQL